MVETSPQNTTVEAIIQYVYKVDKSKKIQSYNSVNKRGELETSFSFYKNKTRRK